MPEVLDRICFKIEEISEKQAFFESELKTNGGSTIKDEVRLLVAERLMELQEADYPAFRTTTVGHNIFVNRAYETLVDADVTNLLGLSWQQFIADRKQGDEYFNRWLEVSKTGAHFAGSLQFQDSKGHYRGQWFVRIVPLGPFKRFDKVWGGRLFPEDDVAMHVADAYGWSKKQ